jgi:NAD(P)-dependent dehydrogenase (short-subunit alcohol dehydrogenase family)
MNDFRDRTACVVGASTGIGRATAERLLEAGARVGVLARRRERVAAIAAPHGERAIALPCDATDPAAVDRAFSELEARFGPCEFLVTCAGLVDRRPIAETSADQWRRLIAANLDSVFPPVRRVLPAMLERGAGAIVCVASISGVHGSSKFPGLVPYVASKSAVIGFVEGLAAEVGGRGVRVNAVSPGSVDTEMLREAAPDAVPVMSADEVAETILFLLSSRSRPIQGQNLHVYAS